MMRRERYPENWDRISLAIRERAEQRCECTGECGAPHVGRCDAPNGARIDRHSFLPWRWERHVCDEMCITSKRCTGVRVILTVSHVDHVETNNDPGNLRALCQRCHLQLDAGDNLARRRERENAARGQHPLPGLGVLPENRRAS